jgi:pyruvate formate lyase activating enzyme
MLKIKLIGAGWKNISLVDVVDSVTFTLWLCGCNLKCPFCHNWRLAVNDPEKCHLLDVDRLLDELEASRSLVDYLHVTGGEPLVQWAELEELLRITKENYSVKNSLNTNLTLYKPLGKLLDRNVVDHIASDLKVPPEVMFGQKPESVGVLWSFYERSLSLVADYNIPLELRIPVSKFSKPELVVGYLDKVKSPLSRISSLVIVVQPLLGEPVTTPRDPGWCKLFCNPGNDLLDAVAESVSKLGFKTRVKKWLSS